MTHPLSLAAGALPEFDPPQVAEAAGRAGFTKVGFTIDPSRWDAPMQRAVQRQLRLWQLSVLDVEVVWIPAGGSLDDGHRRIVEAGAELGAGNVLVVSSEPDPARSAAALARLCEWAAPAGLRVCLEFLMITAIRTLPAALAVVRACGHPAAAVLVDSLHLQRAGHRPAELATVEPERLPYLQFCDGPAGCRDSHEDYLRDALDLRSAPGEGELPLDALLDIVPAGCPLSLEIRSRHYRERYPEPAARASVILSRTLAFFDRRAREGGRPPSTG